MRNGKCNRLIHTAIIAYPHERVTPLFRILAICLLFVAGCQRFDRLVNSDLDDKFPLKDVQGTDVPIKGIKPTRSTASASSFDTKRSRFRESIKRGISADAKIGDQAPKANSIVETGNPDANLSDEIKNLPPELKALLQQYLADAKSGKSNTSLASTEKSPEKNTEAKLDESEMISQSAAPVVRRSINDDTSEEKSAVVPASTFPPVNSEGAIPTQKPIDSTETIENWSELLAKSIAALEKELSDRADLTQEARLKRESDLRMLQLAAGKIEESTRPITGLNAREQEYMRHQFQALYDATNPDGIPVRRKLWSTVMESQRQATDHLAAISDLEVRSASFCTSVDGYGLTKKFVGYQFKPDQDFLLYCELENVDAEEIKDGFETQLQGRYEIIDKDGQRVADQLLPMEKEVCKNHRRDYFIVYRIYMPMQILPGSYQFRLTIEDMKAKKFGQTMLDFQIAK